MASKKPSIDFREMQYRLADQFRGLDTSNPSSWPNLPRYLLLLAVVALVLAAFWYFMVSDKIAELDAKKQEELKLKDQYVQKYNKVVNLEPLLKQRQQVEQFIAQLEKQLPGKAEMDALLSDINQAGVGRNLQFETFKPAAEQVKDYYALLPVSIKVSGKFPEVAGFASDIAHLSRIVTLSNISVNPVGGAAQGKEVAKDTSTLVMEATANTYRYLDKSEMPQKSASKPGQPAQPAQSNQGAQQK